MLFLAFLRAQIDVLRSDTMVKKAPAKSFIRKQSMDQTPVLDRPRSKLNYREIKRRSIIAGLRVMKAPAALWLQRVLHLKLVCLATTTHESSRGVQNQWGVQSLL